MRLIQLFFSKCLCFSIFGLLGMLSNSQASIISDTIKQATQQSIYDQFSPNNILTGTLYLERYLARSGHALHRDSNFNSESLTYDGIFYPDVKLSYDTFLDKVVVFLTTEDAASRIIIDKTRASSFTIAGDQFLYFEDSIAGQGPFHKLVKSDRVLLFAKRITVKKVNSQNRYRDRNHLEPEDEIYIRNASGTYLVKKRKDVLEAMSSDPVFEAYKKRRKKIALYKSSFEFQLIKLMSEYESKQ